MAKLKFDRSINLDLKSNNKMTVPKDEVWKVTIGVDTREKNASLYINDALAYDGFNVRENGASYLNVTLGGGTEIYGKLGITGVVFKIIE